MYKAEKTAARCLESLLTQTCRAIEVVVVDDGSPDGGFCIVEEYAQKDSRIRLFRTENRGQGAARNFGIRQAVGEYIGFVDSDDYIAPRMYEAMYAALLKSGAPLAVCGNRDVFAGGEGRQRELGGVRFGGSGTVDGQKALEWYLNCVYLPLNSACLKLVKKTLFTDGGVWFPEGHRYAEDLVFSGGLFCAAEKVAVVDEPLYFYVHDEGSFTYRYSLKNADDVCRDYEEVCAYAACAGYGGSMDNFALSMQFASLKQLYWAQEKPPKAEARRLAMYWRAARKKGGWKPRFSGHDIPLAHRMKIRVSALGLTRPACFLIRRLRFIPFFKYMT